MELYASPPVPIVTASVECLLHEPAAAGCPISPDIYIRSLSQLLSFVSVS